MPVSLASSSAASMHGAMVPIASYTSTGTGTGADFTNIPQIYQDLVLVQYLRSSRSATTEPFWQRINNDSASNYSYTNLSGDGASATSSRSSNQTVMNRFNIPAASSTSGIFGSSIVHIFNYANTTTYKTLITRSACDLNGSGDTNLSVGLWRSTSAITTINVATENGSNLVAGSNIVLYGIRRVGQ
jgi:hypothetical protein